MRFVVVLVVGVLSRTRAVPQPVTVGQRCILL